MLFVAAFEPELSKLREIRTSVWAVPVGIGLPAAAVGTARALSGRSPKAVVLLGTCGAFPGRGLAVGDVVVATGVRLGSAAAARGEGAMPAPMVEVLPCDSTVLRVPGKSVQVATTLAVTTTAGLAAAMTESTGCDVEHLEAYAIALACRAAGVPFMAVLVVANEVGSEGRAQWAEHHQRVSDALAEVVNGVL
jgi:futalosine hydrolase